MKKIRRRVLIREYDYRKMINRAWGGIVFDGMMLYTRSEFTPLTRDAIEKEVVWQSLSGSSRQHWQYRDKPRQMFDGMKDYLYNPQYARWKVIWDEEDYLCVQARVNTPVSRIGWGVFEYDPESVND